jgi:polyisoprenyl-teichoic acid--peptidoglycan teichoic acid transferase
MVIIGTNIYISLEIIASVVFVLSMNNNSRKPGYSIDGFVSNSRGRHVGTSASRLQGVPQRRPGFHVQPTVSNQPTASRSTVSLPPNPLTNRASGASIVPSTAAPAPITSRRRQRNASETKSKKAHPRLKKIAKRTGLALAVLVIISLGWLGWKIFNVSGKVFGSGSNLLGFLNSSPMACESTGRCNFIMAGYSVDDPNNTGGTLTDSIMIISLDTKNHTAFMMSVPRDLYVNIPGSGYAKINETYEDGQREGFSESGYAQGGMGLLEKVVSTNFGIPINNYILLDNNAVKQAVDAVGGVTVNIQSTDPRGIYDAFTQLKLSNGEDTLNGQEALNLVRARGDNVAGDVSYGLGSDFVRTSDQREVLMALKQKAVSSGVMSNPIKLGELFDAFGNNIKTDLTTSNVRRLYDLTKGINNSSIQSYGLNDVSFNGNKDADLLSNYWTPTGQEALVPAAGMGDYSQIQELVKQITSSDPATRENANIVILNASNTVGLAAAEKQVVTNKGLTVTTVGDASATQASNTIIDNSKGKDPATLSDLKGLFGNTTATNAALSATYPNADFIIVLGSSQQMPANANTSSTSTTTSQ